MKFPWWCLGFIGVWQLPVLWQAWLGEVSAWAWLNLLWFGWFFSLPASVAWPRASHPQTAPATQRGWHIQQGIQPQQRLPAAKILQAGLADKFAAIVGAGDKGEQLLADMLVADCTRLLLQDEHIVAVMVVNQGDQEAFQIPFGEMVARLGLKRALLGVLRAWLLASESLAGGWHIEAIAVDPRYRGQGAGSTLIQALMTEAQQCDRRGLTLEVVDTNPAAQALYQRLGFQPLKRHQLSAWRGLLAVPFSSTLYMACTLSDP
ncbi:GNAT family N-acetyltransferase [Bacterioplanes sanyensis]|nr:N-acetyltransferase [Bacterioplanes sanyensis]